MSFGSLKWVWRSAAVVMITLLALVGATGATFASVDCASGADACLTVNSNVDVVEPDDVLSLREALLYSSGLLNDLTSAEAKQVHLASSVGLAGVVDINFDPTVFCDGCASQVIELQPPGFGGGQYDGAEDGSNAQPPGFGGGQYYTGEKILALPPGFGGGQAVRIGLGLDGGREVSAPVVLDGSQLTDEFAGLWLPGIDALRGFHLRNFAGHALEVEADSESPELFGSNDDGVTFSGNGVDVVVLGSE